MFNLTVDTAHTFYVGVNGWLVHNGNCEPRFINLRAHAQKHGPDLGIFNTQKYLDQALENIKNGTKVLFRHDGQTKAAFITKIGDDNYLFTSTTESGKVIFTHMPVDSKYLSNIGITLPKGIK